MASTFFTLLDDIATLLDDVAVVTKAATKKTAAVMREDAMITAGKTADLRPDRQIAVIFEIAKRSLRNKAVIIPAVLGFSVAAPALVMPMLLSCAGYICFEGFHKTVKKMRGDAPDHSLAKNLRAAPQETSEAALIALEKEKIRGASRTDMILSTEISILALASAASFSFWGKALFLAAVGIGVTAAVYTTVAGILAVDHLAVRMARTQGGGLAAKAKRKAGDTLLTLAPSVMRAIAVLGTGAMFYLGGSILLQAVPALAPLTQALGWFGGSLAAGFAAGAAGYGAAVLSKISGITGLVLETAGAARHGAALIFASPVSVPDPAPEQEQKQAPHFYSAYVPAVTPRPDAAAALKRAALAKEEKPAPAAAVPSCPSCNP